MEQIRRLFSGLSTRNRVIVIFATAAVFWAVLALGRLASTPTMTLLYAGVENASAGEVVSALEQRGVAYDVRGGSIFVDASKRDELRMLLASEGLPANSNKGYELLDNLSGFGTTSQMFNAAYWRAIEGELARTIASHPAISSARVHIAATGTNPFQRDVQPSASVSLTASSAGISAKHARALKYLVASAVTGLSIENVAVIDSAGNLVGDTEQSPGEADSSRASAIGKRVQRILEAHVGPGNAVVEVSIDTVNSTESIREKRIDPESRVAISTDTEEKSNNSSGNGGGVSVASNLPDGNTTSGDSSTSQANQVRERVNYEVSETQREIIHAPGAIKRLTVAVLVNGTSTVEPDGSQVFEPRSDVELSALRELVSSSVGFDESRGDVVTIKSLQFQRTIQSGTIPEPSLLSNLSLDLMSIIQAGILALVAIVLGVFVIRPALSKTGVSSEPHSLPAPGNPVLTKRPTRDEASVGQALDGEIDDGGSSSDIPRLTPGEDAEAANTEFPLPVSSVRSESQVEKLRVLIGERQDETVEILRNWLEGEEEKAL